MSTQAQPLQPLATLHGPARSLLERTRVEWRRRVLVRAVLSGAASALATAVALVVIDQLFALPVGARGVLRLIPAITFLLPLARAASRVFGSVDPERLALLAEESRPELGYQLSTLIGRVGSGTESSQPAASHVSTPTRTAGIAPLPGDPLQLAGIRPRHSGASQLAALFERRALAALNRVNGTVVPVDATSHARRLGIATLIALAVLLLVPGGPRELVARWVHLTAGPASGIGGLGLPAAGRTAADARMAFRDLRVRVEPPAYTGLPSYDVSVEGTVSALAGSRITVSASVPDEGARIEGRVLRGGADLSLAKADVQVDGDVARIAWQLSASDRGVELGAFADTSAATAPRPEVALARTVVAIDATRDAPPAVELALPARDLVLATPNGVIPVRATARDDHGLASFRLVWILTRGSGESFEFTDGGAAWTTVSGSDKEKTGTFSLDVKAMELEAGDVLHVRANAADRNNVTGPGEGSSVTRVIRIAQEGDEDEASTLIGFPIEAQKNPVLTQRMIVILTEDLLVSAPTLSRDSLRQESAYIAMWQGRARALLEETAYPNSLGGAIPDDPDRPGVVNRDLIPAIDAMYEAERSLMQADLQAALPPENRALEIVQKLRESERVFVTANPLVQPIDIAAARGTGKIEDADPSARSAGVRSPTLLAHVARLEALATRLHREESAAVASTEISAAAAVLLEDRAVDSRAGGLLARAAAEALNGKTEEAGRLVAQARALLVPANGAGRAGPSVPTSAAGSEFTRALAQARAGSANTASGSTNSGERSPASGLNGRTQTAVAGASPGAGPTLASDPGSPARPFVFATVSYASGDWNASPLVPTNLIHSLAIYTDLAVAPEGVDVALDSPDLFRHPFVYLNGHLPVHFSEAEAANLRAYVDRGGFVFIDDHNHDIDGAFSKTIVAELARVFGEGALAPLPNDHEIFHSFFHFDKGPPTTSHELNGWGDALVHEHLLAIQRGGRIRVLYSNKDYSSEWSYHAANKRFSALDNTRFGVNVIVYALTR